MNHDDQIKFIPKYCIRCGSQVRITLLERKYGQYFGEWVCDSCGYEDGAGWSELVSHPNTFRHKLFYSIKSAFHSFRMGSLPMLTFNSFTNRLKDSKQDRDLSFSQIIEQADFPVLGLSSASYLLPISFSFGDHIGSTYSDQFESPTNIVKIENQSVAQYIYDDQQYYEDWANDLRNLVIRWGEMLLHSKKVLGRRNLYQTVNMNAIANPPVRQFISLATGEELDWQIKTIQAEQLAYAWTRHDNGLIQVWSAGAIATEIENLLGNLTVLQPNSPNTKHHQAGFDKWRDHYESQWGGDIE